MHKISLFYLFIFEIQSILESRDETGHIHFWPSPSKNFDRLLIFVNLYQHAKNQSISSVHSSDRLIVVFYRQMPTLPKFSITFYFVWIRTSKQINSLILSAHSWDTLNFRATSIFDHAPSKHFWSAFNFCELICKKRG